MRVYVMCTGACVCVCVGGGVHISTLTTMYSCAFGGAVWVVFLLYWYECLSVVLACEPTCRHCVYLVL